MKPTFVKKNTAGGTSGITWEAGEVKPVHPSLAEELVKLAPEDFEIVQEGEHTAPAPTHNSPVPPLPSSFSDGQGIKVETPETTVVEVEVEGSAEENQAVAAQMTEHTAPAKATRATKKARATSAE
jgi:hypothetical protein